MGVEDQVVTLSPERIHVLLTEYEKAQDSAEHHDDLVWTVTTLNWVGSAVLMGFVLNGLGGHLSARHKAVLLVVAGVGILLSVLVWRWARQLRDLKVQKYRRCQAIEATLGMQQHSTMRYPVGSGVRAYAVLMGAFLIAWLVIAVVVGAS